MAPGAAGGRHADAREGQRTGDDPHPLRPGGGDRRDAGLHQRDPRGDPHRWTSTGTATGCRTGSRATAIPLLGRIVAWRRPRRSSPAPTAWTRRSRWRCSGAGGGSIRRSWTRSEVSGATRTSGPGYWGARPERHLGALEPEDQILMADEARLDDIAPAFARVIDAKSPYTYLHSERVAELAVTIGRRLHFSDVQLRDLRRAGAAARHRQARRLEPDSRQARPTHRAGAGARSGCIRLTPSGSWSGSGVLGDRRDRERASRAARREGLPPRTHGGAALAHEPGARGGGRVRGDDRGPALPRRAPAARGGRHSAGAGGHVTVPVVGGGAGFELG